jgi:hypothetical protein
LIWVLWLVFGVPVAFILFVSFRVVWRIDDELAEAA